MSDETKVSLVNFGNIKADGIAKNIESTTGNVTKINDLLRHAVTSLNQLQAASQVQNKNNSDVQNAFKSLQDEIKNLGRGVDTTNHNTMINRGRDEVERKNSNKSNRAVYNALHGELKKNRGALDVLKETLKNCFNQTLEILKDGFKQSLRSYDELSSSLRKQNLSKELKNQAHLLSDLANTGSFAVSKQSASAITEYLAANDTALFKKFANKNATETEKKLYGEIINVGALLKESGLSEDKITTLMASANASNIEEFRKIAVQAKASGSEGEAARLAIDKLLSTPGGVASLGTNGFDKLNASLSSVRDLASTGAANAELSAGLVELATKIENREVYDLDEQKLIQALAISGDKIGNPKELTDAFNKRLLDINAAANRGDTASATTMAKELKDAIKPLSQDLPDFVVGIQNAANRAASGNLNTSGAETFEEIEQNISDNRQDGKANDWIGNIVSKINIATSKLGIDGGILGGLSTSMDEFFGGKLSMEDTVSKGIPTIITILLGIAASKLLSGPVDLLKSIGATLGINKIMSTLFNRKNSDTPNNTGTPQGPRPTINADALDKQYKEAIEKFKSLPENIKTNTKNLFGNIKKTFSNAGTNIKKTFSNVGTNIKKTFTGIGGNIKKTFTGIGGNIKKTWKQAVVSIANAPKGIKSGAGKVGKGLAIGGGAVLGLASLFADTGAFDSLMPILESFITSLVPPMKMLADTLAPTIEKFLQTASPILGKIIEALAPVLDTLLQTLAPVLSMLLETFAPILDIVLKSLTPVLQLLGKILVPLQPVFEMIASTLEFALKPIQLLAEILEIEHEEELRERDQKKMEEARKKDAEIDAIGKRRKEELAEYTDDQLKKIAEGVAKTTNNTGMSNAIGTADRESLINMIRFNSRESISDENFAALILNQTGIQHKRLADGGIINKATPAIVGEDGKEAILPLTKPGALSKVLQNLTPADKLQLLKSLLSQSSFTFTNLLSALAGILKSKAFSFFSKDSNSTGQSSTPQIPDIANGVPGNDPATIEKILSYAGANRNLVYDLIVNGRTSKHGYGLKKREAWFKEALTNAANQEGRDLIRGTYAERALDYGVSELGKPYILRSLGKIGYVCNELVNAAVQASGFDMGKFRVHGVKATFANIQKGKYSDGSKYPDFRLRPDLTPQTAIPGMVFFQDSRKNKEGGFQPGHIGLVYYGHQKLHSSGGSGDYTKGGFLQKWQTPCRGVTVTPFDNNSYVIGEFPGLFEQASGEWNPPKQASVPFGPGLAGEIGQGAKVKSVEDTGLMTSEEITDLLVKQTGVNAAVAAQYVSQAMSLIDGKSQSEVLAILIEIAKYIKGIALTGANKSQIMSVAKPPMSVYQ